MCSQNFENASFGSPAPDLHIFLCGRRRPPSDREGGSNSTFQTASSFTGYLPCKVYRPLNYFPWTKIITSMQTAATMPLHRRQVVRRLSLRRHLTIPPGMPESPNRVESWNETVCRFITGVMYCDTISTKSHSAMAAATNSLGSESNTGGEGDGDVQNLNGDTCIPPSNKLISGY